MTATYDLAQICENGHVITIRLGSYPQHSKAFCDQCGAPTLSHCRECDASIRGYYYVAGEGGVEFATASWYKPPLFCPDCGKPYPWTLGAIDSLNHLVDLADKLSPKQRRQLRMALDDLVRDTPGTQLAIARLKLLGPKLGEEVWNGIKDILIRIATESVKRDLGIG